jgi:endoglucanase Acf2
MGKHGRNKTLNSWNQYRHFRLSIILVTAVLGVGSSALPGTAQTTARLGEGSYLTALPPGAKGPPKTIYKTDRVPGPTPTNRWWSSLAWLPFSERQFPHPLAVQAETGGLRVFYPGNRIHVTEKTIFAGMPGGGEDLVVQHSEQPQFPDARLDAHSDWFVHARFAAADRSLTVAYGHGSPYVYAVYEGGSPQVTFGRDAEVWVDNASTIGVTVDGKHYGLFGPQDSTWSSDDRKRFTNRSSGRRYCSLAVLPERSPAALLLFQRHAHAHVVDTRIAWRYDPATSTVETTFSYATTPMEGQETQTLFALYPHQWQATSAALLDYQYPSIRGVMKLGKGEQFVTRHVYPGVLPVLPKTPNEDVRQVQQFLSKEPDSLGPAPRDTYWEGKALGKLVTLAALAEQMDAAAAADKFREQVRQRLEHWFTATDAQGAAKRTGVFAYDRNWGTLIGYPPSYGSDSELNDHHFHYGYFLRAAAEILRFDPDWGRGARWGGMARLLVRDIANPARDDGEFPFLRSFDVYAGHSWASGHARFGDGNNQESTSEAMNAWCGLILWGEATGDRALRDLGIYLFTTELAAINAYWFDVLGENRPAAFPQTTLGLVWGGKADYGTWFSAKPENIYGINWMPFHGGSLYLGLYPEYVQRNYQSLAARKGDARWDEWADLVWMYRALADGPAAMSDFTAGQATLKPEAGHALAHTYHWIAALAELGQVDRHVTADTPLYAVFRRDQQRTYVVYNMRSRPLPVRFSDGFAIPLAAPGFSAIAKPIP